MIILHHENAFLILVEGQIQLLLTVCPRCKCKVAHMNIEREVVRFNITGTFVDGLRNPEYLTSVPDIKWMIIGTLTLNSEIANTIFVIHVSLTKARHLLITSAKEVL